MLTISKVLATAIITVVSSWLIWLLVLVNLGASSLPENVSSLLPSLRWLLSGYSLIISGAGQLFSWSVAAALFLLLWKD